MKRFWWLVWLLVPVAMLYFHFGAGQSAIQLEELSSELAPIYARIGDTEASAGAEEWEAIAEELSAVIEKVPEGKQALRRELELDLLLVNMYGGKLVESMRGMEMALEVAYAEGADAAYIERLHDSLGRTLFGIGWVMRIEGSHRSDWQEVVERSRQHFRMLAEQESDDATRQADLENTIRLLRMDRAELKGRPVPPEAQNGRGRGVGEQMQRPGQGQGQPGQGQGEEPADSRQGAGLEELAKQRGS